MVQCQEELSSKDSSKDAGSVAAHFGESLSVMYDTIQSIRASFERFGVFSELTLWIDPMRQLLLPSEEESNRNEDVDFWMYRDNLSWWATTHHRSSHEPEDRIANMDTSINEIGLGLLAMKAFQERHIGVYHPNFIWTVWFPHVIVLFKKSGDCPSMLEHPSSLFLESLVRMVPERSLVAERIIHGKPDAPLELFHLLSNRLMTRIPKTSDIEEGKEDEDREEANISLNEEAEFRMRSQRTVGIIKALLGRFTPVNQVQIVEKLIHNCSTPGLQARFLDLLRPVILIPDPQTEKLLWNLLMSIINDLFKKYWDRKEQVLIDVDVLINQDVEVSVGAITMIQMWSLAEGKELPVGEKGIGDELRGFHDALQKLLDRWSSKDDDSSLSAPQLHYRLFLLDSAIQCTLQTFVK